MEKLDINQLLKKFKEEEKQNEKRIKNFFPDSDDLLTIVLRGHLLVEEYLDRLNSHCFHAPEYYKEARLSFAKKILIAQAQVLVPHPHFFFPALSKLNELRNNLAHNLDSPKLKSKVKSFVAFVQKEYSEEYRKFSREQTLEKKIRGSIAFLLGQLQVLNNIIEFMEKSRAYGARLQK